MTIHDIPAINATLNATATVLIVFGIVSIKRDNKKLHRFFMAAAIIVSMVFLVGYVAHKIAMQGVHTPFLGEGLIAWAYYIMLATHIVLAMAIVPLVARTAWLAICGHFELHKKWARVTYPIWLYVSITGVLVYEFLYVWYPAPSQ